MKLTVDDAIKIVDRAGMMPAFPNPDRIDRITAWACKYNQIANMLRELKERREIAEENPQCETCTYGKLTMSNEPCNTCRNYSEWKSKWEDCGQREREEIIEMEVGNE